MRSFSCPVCGAPAFFENSVCLACGTPIGFDRPTGAMFSLAPDASAGPAGPPSLTAVRLDGTRVHPCANLVLAECNWLADEGAPAGLCDCCALTRTRPADDELPALRSFARTEAAKRRLVYQLDDLGLPVVSRAADPEHGLAFDLLSSAAAPVVTGHDDGVITIDLAEGDAGHREAMREQLAEPYRTLLGHVRHETGHWYWQVLVERASDPTVAAPVPGRCSGTSARTTPRRCSGTTTTRPRPTGRTGSSAPMPRPTRGRTGPRPSPTCCTSATRCRRPRRTA